MLAQSVMAVDVDENDLELQKSLASLGQHFRARDHRQSSVPQTPLSMSGTSSASGSIAFGTATAARHRDALEDAEEKEHEAMTAAAVRAREKRRKQAEQRRLRREQLGEDDEEAMNDPAGATGVEVESDVNTDDDAAEEAHSVRKHSVRQAAALDTANEVRQRMSQHFLHSVAGDWIAVS